MKKIIFLIYLLGAFISNLSLAAETMTFPVSSTVQPNCKFSYVQSASPLGGYTPSGTGSSGVRHVDITCTKSTAYTITANAGLNGTMTNRKLISADGLSVLNYTIQVDLGSTSPNFGDGTSGTSVYNGIGTGINNRIITYFKIAAGQYVKSGTYTDTVVYVLSY
jgi:spore coat protein U-like protein